jgi:glutamate racemase
MRREKIDTLILGCTHFSMLRDAISAFLPGVTIIDSGKEAARALALDALSPPFMAEAALDCRGKKREHPRERGGRLRLYTTLDARALSRYASAVLERPVHAQKIESV